MTDFIKRVILMPGVHKTATTHLQAALQKARPMFHEKNIALLTPSDIRGAFFEEAMKRLRKPDNVSEERAKLTNILREQNNEHATLLWHDENIIGACNQELLFGPHGQLYPWGGQRIERLCQLFPDSQIEIALSVRVLADFFDSAYAQSQNYSGYKTVEDYFDGNRPTRYSWTDTLAYLSAKTKLPITFWRYEEYPTIVPRLMDTLFPEANIKLDLSGRAKRVRVTQNAINALEDKNIEGDKQATRDALKGHQANHEDEKAKALGDEDRMKLSLAYDGDIIRAARLPNIRYLSCE